MSLIAFLLILFSATLHAIWNFASKKVAGDITTMWLGLIIACTTLTPFILFLDPAQLYIENVYPHIIISGITHAVYFFYLSRAYEHGEISVVYPIARGIGVFGTALLAIFIVGEEISIIGIAGIILIIIGIFALGLKNGHQKKSILFALLVGAMIISYSIVDKIAVGLTNPIFYIYAFTTLFALFLTPHILIKKRNLIKQKWKENKKFSFIIGIGSIGTYLIILFVFQIAQVNYVVALRESAVAIGAILGFIFLKEKITKRKLAGIIAILVGAILIKLAV